MSVQSRLRFAREHAGFATAADFARRIDVEVGTYRHHENGTRGIRSEVLQMYAEVLRVDPTWLMTGRGKPRPNLELSPTMHLVAWAPAINWVQAGQLNASAVDQVGASEMVPQLSQRKSVVALEVRGTSMNRIAPPGSFIIVDFEDRELKDGRLFVVRHGDETTFKRYRSSKGPARLEPESYEAHDTIFPTSDFEVVGRVIYVVRPA